MLADASLRLLPFLFVFKLPNYLFTRPCSGQEAGQLVALAHYHLIPVLWSPQWNHSKFSRLRVGFTIQVLGSQSLLPLVSVEHAHLPNYVYPTFSAS